jgi:hypothetical protein
MNPLSEEEVIIPVPQLGTYLSCNDSTVLAMRLIYCSKADARTWDELPLSLAGLMFSLREEDTFSIILSSSCLLF